MADKLSNLAEYYIARALADGKYPSRAAVLEAAIAALCEKDGGDDAQDGSFSTIELSPEDCAKLQADALSKQPKSGKPGGFSISE